MRLFAAHFPRSRPGTILSCRGPVHVDPIHLVHLARVIVPAALRHAGRRGRRLYCRLPPGCAVGAGRTLHRPLGPVPGRAPHPRSATLATAE